MSTRTINLLKAGCIVLLLVVACSAMAEPMGPLQIPPPKLAVAEPMGPLQIPPPKLAA